MFCFCGYLEPHFLAVCLVDSIEGFPRIWCNVMISMYGFSDILKTSFILFSLQLGFYEKSFSRIRIWSNLISMWVYISWILSFNSIKFPTNFYLKIKSEFFLLTFVNMLPWMTVYLSRSWFTIEFVYFIFFTSVFLLSGDQQDYIDSNCYL